MLGVSAHAALVERAAASLAARPGRRLDLGTDGYPKELEVLVEGVDLVGQVDKRVKFLRRVPLDPMTGDDEWGLRSFQDEPDSSSWGGENIFDVYSLSAGVGLNGVPYAQW